MNEAKEAARVAYEKFSKDVNDGRERPSWDQLPDNMKNTWITLMKAMQEIFIFEGMI